MLLGVLGEVLALGLLVGLVAVALIFSIDRSDGD
jgi:hypothetical protein